LLAALSTTWGCSSGSAPVDIGDGRTGEKLEDYAAVWEGYAEAHEFSDGSDKLKLTLDATGNGTLEIGDSARLPPATDPNVGYAVTFGVNYEIQNLVPGVLYPLNTAKVESARVQFSVNPNEVERDWCAMQTSYPVNTFALDNSTGYACWPDGRTLSKPDGTCEFSNDDFSAVVDCRRMYLCNFGEACACDAQKCTVNEPPLAKQGSYTKFDAALLDGGNSLVGTMKIGPDEAQSSVTIRLQRH